METDEKTVDPKERKKPKVRVIVGIVLLALGLSCSLYSLIGRVRADNEKEALTARARENAAAYVSEKYGFDAELIEDDDKYHANYNAYFEEDKIVAMQNGDKKFYVLAKTAENPDFSGFADSYQDEEIKAAFFDKVSEFQAGGKVIEAYWGCPNDARFLIMRSMYHNRFDGNDLDEALEDCKGKLEMVFANAELSDSPLAEWLTSHDIECKLTSFDSEQRAEEFSKLENINDHSYEIYAPYITGYVELTPSGKESGISYKLKSRDDFRYCYFPTESLKYEDSSDRVAVSEIEQSEFTKHYAYYNDDYCLRKPLSKAYKFTVKYGNVCVYYPLKKFEGMELEQVGAAYYFHGGFANNYDIARAEVCGEYAVFTLPVYDQEFMLVDNTGQEEFVPQWKKKKQ